MPEPTSAPLSSPGCRLCAGPLPRGAEDGFCCEGCARVSEILGASGFEGDPRSSAAYLQAVRAGIVPADRPAEPAPAEMPRGSGDARIATLSLDGLWCPSCAWLVESVLGRTPGVRSARVTFFADLAEVIYDPMVLDEKAVERAVEGLGYRVKRDAGKRDRGPLLRFGVAAFLQMNVMMLTLGLYTDRSHDPERDLMPWLITALSIPVIFVSGWPMHVRAWKALRARALVMDSLISFASIAAFVYSCVAMLRGSDLLYFDGAGALIAFRLLGQLLESEAFRSAGKAAEAVRRLLPKKARKLGAGGGAWVAVDTLAPGDLIRIAPGERVPLDGEVVGGEGRVSTAVVDGEPHPRPVGPGAAVPGGSVCGETALDLRVTAPAASSLLSRMADHVARASGRRGTGPELADALARLFIPCVLLLALVTFAGWLAHGLPLEPAFLRGLAVLVVSCPCALGVAAPLSRVVATGALARRGIIVRGEGALDQVAEATRVAFDKTGTLTLGRPALLARDDDGFGADEALVLLAALEERSGHPIARAVEEALPARSALPQVEGIQGAPGCGVSGTIGGALARAGRPTWVEEAAGRAPERLRALVGREQAQGRTAILLAHAGRWAAFSFGDQVRAEAGAAVAALRALKLDTVVLSGDSQEVAEVVATRVGASAAVGGCLPEEKARRLEAAAAQDGHRAIFVGDGINDAPGLAAAVGVAVASGTDFARETADVLLLEHGLDALPFLVETGRRMRTIIRQNLAWAAAYNACLIPLAIAGQLTPVWAAGAMVGSGLLVVANAQRLQPRASPGGSDGALGQPAGAVDAAASSAGPAP